MPSRREIVEQQAETKRLAEAVRDLRISQLETADPAEAERLGAALKVMRERAEGASLTLARLQEQRAEMGSLGRAVADFRAALAAFRGASLPEKGAMLARGAAATTAAGGQLPSQALQALAGAAGQAAAAVTGMARAVGRFVEASNPGLMLQFGMAVQDLMASLGRVFEPVIKILLDFANVLNGFITSLQPVLGPLVSTLANAWGQIAKAVLDVVGVLAEALLPVLQFLADFILPPIVAVFRVLADAIRAVVNWFRELIGLDPLERASGRGDQRTVAARPAQQIGAQQIGEQFRAAAFGSAANPVVESMRENNALTRESNGILRTIADRLQADLDRVPERLGALVDDAAAAISGFFN